MGVEIYVALRKLLGERGIQTEVADEGGFAPKLNRSDEVFTLLVRAIETAGYFPGVDAFLGIDAAASEFFDAERGLYELDGAWLSAKDLAWQYRTWQANYPLISVEDPFDEDAWVEWTDFTKRTGEALQVVGDDLYATNTARIRVGLEKKATNAVLVKPNQVGTLTETLQAVLVAQEGGQNVIVSHRSGETEDTFISDLAVAVGAGQIKTGAPSRSDRTAKYNQLLRIEQATRAPLAKSLQVHLQHNQPS
jgi:enolase